MDVFQDTQTRGASKMGPKMQMNSETFFQGNSMICSGLFQGLKEDQEKKLWGIFLIRLFENYENPQT